MIRWKDPLALFWRHVAVDPLSSSNKSQEKKRSSLYVSPHTRPPLQGHMVGRTRTRSGPQSWSPGGHDPWAPDVVGGGGQRAVVESYIYSKHNNEDFIFAVLMILWPVSFILKSALLIKLFLITCHHVSLADIVLFVSSVFLSEKLC